MALSDRAILEAEYRQLAKKADQRMVRLEKLSQEKGFENVKEFAYKKAQRDITKKWGGNKDKPRFNTTPKGMSDTQLMRKISDMRAFLDKPSSTKSEIISIYQKGADTINKEYKDGAPITWQDMALFYQSKQADKMKSKYKDSAVMIRAIKSIKTIGINNLTKADIKEFIKGTYIISDDKEVNAIAIKMFQNDEYTIRRKDIFKGEKVAKDAKKELLKKRKE